MSTQAGNSSIFRNQFQPTPLAVQEEQDEQTKLHAGKVDSNTYAKLFKLEEGKNFFRIYPAHPGGKGGYSQMLKQVYLPMMREDRDANGKPLLDSRTGQPVMKESVKSVFDSRLHGSTRKDVIDEYVKFGERTAKDLFPDDDAAQKEYLKYIHGTGFQGEKGILYQVSYILYADQLIGNKRVFGRLQYKAAIRKRLNEMSAVEAANSPIATEPFSHPDDGRAICITVNKKAQPADYYKVDFYAPMIPNGGGRIQLFPLDDIMLEDYMKVKSLEELYVNVYKRSDFELALKGLEFFDNKYGYKFLQEPEFLTILEEINDYYPMENPAENNVSARSAKSDTDLPFGSGQPAPAPLVNKIPANVKASSAPIAPAPMPAPTFDAEPAGFDADEHNADPFDAVDDIAPIQTPAPPANDRMAALRAKMAAK